MTPYKLDFFNTGDASSEFLRNIFIIDQSNENFIDASLKVRAGF